MYQFYIDIVYIHVVVKRILNILNIHIELTYMCQLRIDSSTSASWSRASFTSTSDSTISASDSTTSTTAQLFHIDFVDVNILIMHTPSFDIELVHMHKQHQRVHYKHLL